MKERILILGGANSQIPLIKYAKDRGLYVITADYLPLNPGHKYAHEYHNVNTVDKDAILRLAMECKIDAISSYASDPGAPSAAFVAEQMNLVGSPYRTVEILSNKYLFRQFLREKGYPTPWFISGVKKREFQSLDFSQAAVLKPVDSSGSKGIFRVVNKNDFDNYFKRSMAYSRGGRVILEEFIDKKGPQIHGEGFVLNGEVIFLLLGDQYFSKVNNMAPFSTIVPSLFHNDIMSRVHEEVKSLIKDVGYMTGGINVEAIRDQEDRIFILEIGARNGGNFMPQLIRHTTGF
ncbi:MAG: ATP-grasp domain-containing protein, partial [Clostridia bacterium]|nr:ATP-grasp domain-containing protein [Clostridia bacterium]